MGDRTRFGEFTLDPANRRLSRLGAPVALNARYFDALALLVRDAGQLVTKDRFLDEVWRGVPVTDEALTQCIRSLRRELGDDAARPRFIETVPKHGYRFVAPVEAAGGAPDARPTVLPATRLPRALRLAGGGIAGAVAAGVIGGLVYGALLVGSLPPGDAAAISTLLVVASLTALVALLGGAGVSGGLALAAYAAERPGLRYVLGGMAGGFVTGAAVRLVGLDAFNLLLGAAPRDITGGAEGALLGAAAGLGASLSERTARARHAVMAAATAAALAGIAIVALGGRLLGGSLAQMTASFDGSRLRLDGLGAAFGETGFGPLTASVTAAAEAALFVGCLVAGVALALRRAP